jgi:glyoxylase-like metal-dependent hydrolase (beta-lactamase superfamily II)
LQQHIGGLIAISVNITRVQAVFAGVFDFGDSFRPDGSDFDVLLQDGQTIEFGSLGFTALPVPGHTPACMAYEVGDAIFVGDTLFMPDVGTARCDFPGGDAHRLYQSVRRLLNKPDATRLFMCHDYPPNDRPVACQSTVGDQKANNIHIRDGITEEAFVSMRTHRDAGLDMPVLILPSIQVNVRAGHLPEPHANGKRYLQIPLDVL